MKCMFCSEECNRWRSPLNVPVNAFSHCVYCDVPDKCFGEKVSCAHCFHYGVCESAIACDDASMCKRYVSNTKLANMPIMLAITLTKLDKLTSAFNRANDCTSRLFEVIDSYRKER